MDIPFLTLVFFRLEMEFKFKLCSLLCVLAFAFQMMDRAVANSVSKERTQIDFGVHDRQVLARAKPDLSETVQKQSKMIVILKNKLKSLKKECTGK